jgi:hypothetical protein
MVDDSLQRCLELVVRLTSFEAGDAKDDRLYLGGHGGSVIVASRACCLLWGWQTVRRISHRFELLANTLVITRIVLKFLFKRCALRVWLN